MVASARMICLLAGAANASAALPAPVSVVSSALHLCMMPSGKKMKNGTLLKLGDCDHNKPLWGFQVGFTQGRLERATPSGDHLCLDVPENKRTLGQALQLWTCNDAEQQQFVFHDGFIKTSDGRLCLDVRAEDNKTLQLWSCISDAENQQWSLTPSTKETNHSISISSATGPVCLDLTDGEESDGTPLQAWDCDEANPNAAQVWQFKSGQLIHQTADAVELCLDIPDNNRMEGQQLQVWTCNGAEQQQFEFSNGSIRTSDGEMCLDLRMEDGRTVQLWKCMPTENQQWSLRVLDAPDVPATKNRIVSITSATGPLCLDLTDDEEFDGTLLQVWDCDVAHPNSAQVWEFNSGQLLHRTADNVELCLDIPDNNRMDGQRLQVWTCNGAEQQQFEFSNGSIRTSDGEMCVDLRTEDGRTVQLWNCDSDSKNQLWDLTTVSPPSAATGWHSNTAFTV